MRDLRRKGGHKMSTHAAIHQAKVIGFVNTCTSWGGGEKWHFETAQFCHNQGYSVIFFCRPGSEIESRLIKANIPTRPLTISNLSFLNLTKMVLLARQFKHLGITTLLLNTPADTKLAAPAAVIAGVNNIIFRRGMPHRIKRNWLNCYLFERCIHRVIANSEAVRTSLSDRCGGIVPDRNITVVENGVKLDATMIDAPPIYAKQAREIVLSTAGRMVKQKNQLALLAMAEKLKMKGINFVLLIAGAGELKQKLTEEVLQRGLNDCVRFTGFVTQMPLLFKSTDIFVFPSLYEGCPNTLIEAAAASKAIVAYDIPPHRELLPDDEYGRLVPLNDIDGLVSAVSELASSAEIREKMGWMAKLRVSTHYNLDKARKKLLALI
ncbi:glycosyltransferase family 1 protein [Corallincola holothuriorum]|uniref:Glycosyltransferase family 1 protein n=2 Tax=Corallincola holothuriorum TaxID=2282215 RepID=A0A368NMJ7_9GAMM|nr:glycosyltransferase family 1 protein [Corallincola holothuriorum]